MTEPSGLLEQGNGLIIDWLSPIEGLRDHSPCLRQNTSLLGKKLEILRLEGKMSIRLRCNKPAYVRSSNLIQVEDPC